MAEIALAARQSRMNAAADLSKTLVGLLCNSRQAVRLVETDDFDSLSGDYLDNAQGRAVDRVAAGYAAAAIHGVNTVGVIPTLNAVEARSFGVDANVASALVGLLTNSRQAIHDGTIWRRMAGGVDNAAAMASPVGAFVAGIARAALPAYTDGDVAIPVLDLAGRLMVNTGGIAVEDDDDSVAAGAAHETVIPLSYGFDGTNWRRVRSQASYATPIDERVMALNANAYVRGISSLSPAGTRGVCIEGLSPANINGVTANLYSLLCAAAGVGIDNVTPGSPIFRQIESRAVGTTPTDERYYGHYSLAFVRGLNSGAAAGSQGVAVEARAYALDTDIAKTLVGLTVNSRISTFRLNGNDWTRQESDYVQHISGTATTTTAAMYTAAIAVGLDSTGAVVLRPVEARALSAYNAAATSLIAINTAASVFGVDNTAGSVVRPVEARNADDGGDFTDTLIGLLVNNRPSYWLVGGSPNWTRVFGNLFSAANGLAITAAVHGPYSIAGMYGYDTSGPTLRAMEARAPGTTPLDERLYGLYSLAFVRALDLSAAAGSQGVGVGAIGSSSVSSSALEAAFGLSVVQPRESGFAAARRGKRFYVTHQTPGTLVTCQTAFVATTPSFMLRINSAAIRAIIRNFNIGIANTPGGITYITAMIDTADRWSAGGNAWTPQNTNEESATAAVALFYDTPTASAAGAGTRYLATAIAPATPGTTVTVDFSDGVLLGHTASTFMVYVWAATTAPQVVFNMEYEEAA